MSNTDKYIGEIYDVLTCIEFVEFTKPKALSVAKYIYQCSCGNKRIIRRDSVRSRLTKACEACVNENSSFAHTTHGMYKTGIYSSWHTMKQRVKGTHNRSANYLAKGIKYDPLWEKFEQFYLEMKEKWFEGAHLDRINNDGDYVKDNCQWLSISDHMSKTHKDVR